ncbi:hypothetical protein AAY473_003796 [Plecturocebus cupreus]
MHKPSSQILGWKISQRLAALPWKTHPSQEGQRLPAKNYVLNPLCGSRTGDCEGTQKHFGRPKWADHLRSGVRDQPGQHGETPSLLKYKNLLDMLHEKARDKPLTQRSSTQSLDSAELFKSAAESSVDIGVEFAKPVRFPGTGNGESLLEDGALTSQALRIGIPGHPQEGRTLMRAGSCFALHFRR